MATTLQPIIVDIHALSHDGRGITSINGQTAFIDGALPNEKVLCQINKKHRHYLEGKTLEILTAAEERTTPPCPHFAVCGGCSLQHMTMDAQIQYKQNALLEQLQRFGKVTPETILPPLSGASWEYRRKARLGVKYVRKKQRVFVGFREKMSSFLTDLSVCLVLHPAIGKQLTEINQLVTSLSQFEHIPQIEVAVGDNAAALVFRHLTDLPQDDLDKLTAFGQKNQLHIYLQPNKPNPITKLWPDDKQMLLSYSLPKYQLELAFHPLDFIQINGSINEKLIELAITLLDPRADEQVLDLFCGLGNFTLPLSRFAKSVTGVEGDKAMVQLAQENAQKNHITNVAFYAANLMANDENFPWLQNKYDKILLDPPRTGAKEIIPSLAGLAAKKIVYVSCNPATLARDAGELVHTLGYKLTKVGVINMFPHTNHVEAIALFEKRE